MISQIRKDTTGGRTLMSDYQLIVIGAGPGGYTAALRAAELGLKTAVVENRETGGTFLNRGCVPVKTLLHASGIYRSAVCGSGLGVHTENARIDLQELFAYKRQVAETLGSGIEGMFKRAKIALLRGKGRILSPDTVEVTGEDGSQILTADHILIATGSVPSRPPIPGLDLPGVMTSDELLEGADHLYRSIVIIGGGVIGVELATFYQELGSEVTIIEGLDRLLPAADRELGQNLAMNFKKQGVKILVNSMVERVEQDGSGLTVRFTTKGEPGSASGEAILCAIGRSPYYEGLFAEGLFPETDGRLLKVDENFETSVKGIYAVGDVSSRIQLAHAAAAQGTACVEKICGITGGIRQDLVPGCIYCHPEIAFVGLTEAEAKERGIPVRTGKCVMGGNARTVIAGAGRCFMKITANAETEEILGAQIMCMNSTDIISEISAAIANRLTPRSMLAFMRPHPTYEEALSDALRDLCSRLERKTLQG